MPATYEQMVERAAKARAAKKRGKVKAKAKPKPTELQPIVADRDYPLPLFMKFTGLSAPAIRRLQRAGLVVGREGNKRFVAGSHWLEFRRSRSLNGYENSCEK